MKPIQGRAFGSIPHLFGSATKCDKNVGIGQHRIATEKVRDDNDLVICQEKLDGSCCAILKKDGILIPISRNGHLCSTSTYEQHKIFHLWTMQHYSKFDFLLEGERLCGEWMIQAHGTRYDIKTPFIVFDIIKDSPGNLRSRSSRNSHKDGYRLNYNDFISRLPSDFTIPKVLSIGKSFSIEDAMKNLGTYGHHGALEETEGAVWRVERSGKIDFLAKYLRRSPDTIGRYLGNENEVVWNCDVDMFRSELPWRIE